MRIAIIADWLTTPGGAEQVIQELCELYPGAPLFTTMLRPNFFPADKRPQVRVSWLQPWYRLFSHHQIFLPWLPRAIEDLDVRGYDVLLSSSHAVGKGIVPPANAVHVCYCHTPIRYAWEMERQYLDDFRVPKFLRKTVRTLLSRVRRWDLASAKRVDVYLANSSTTQERIKRIYNRESTVIPPPVADRYFEVAVRAAVPHPSMKPYYLAVGRLVPYKRFDLLIELANTLGLPLKIAGRGHDEQRLRRLAGPTVEFVGFVPLEELPALYANAEALFFPQFEDAGIVLLEAQACGTPAIAFKAGGALDAIEEGKTGVFFGEQSIESMAKALEIFRQQRWDREAIRESAHLYSRANFHRRVRSAVDAAYATVKRDHAGEPLPIA